MIKEQMKRAIFTIIGLMAVLTAVHADEVTFVVSAPKAVAANEYFNISYTVNRGNAKEPRIPAFDDFEVLSGPNRSQRSEFSSNNGKVTQSYSLTYTYTLMPKSEGTFTIPAATVEIDGKQYTSNTAKIKVLPPDKVSQQRRSGSTRGNARSGSSVRIGEDELFMRATLSKTKIYEQEAVLLTYKVYSLVNLRNLSNHAPDIKDCLVQEVDLSHNREMTLEHYNGRNYNTLIWRQFVLFPQRSGDIEIPSIDFEGVVGVPRQRIDMFDLFDGMGYTEIKKQLPTKPLTLHVQELPSGKPADFSGGVGKFDISSTISTTDVKANEAVTLRLVISGVGNMKLIKTPDVAFPEDFEIYDPKVDNKIKLATDGFRGNKVIEYLAVPRHGGEYTIPPVKFSYFDTESKEYKTLETGGYTLNVAKSTENSAGTVASFVGKEELRMLGSDIRYMKTGDVSLRAKDSRLFGSFVYWLCYIVPLLCFAAYILLHRKQMAENANIAKMRTKKANKVADKRLKLVRKFLKENKKNEFYDEMLKTLWGYMSDKLSIPVSRLSKENIATELAGKGVPEELIKEFVNVLGESEFARYAPGDANAAMDNVYKMATDVIGKMENTIKR